MILGIGIDLISIEKIAKSVKSEAFQRKVFTSAEIAICEAVSNSAERYAGKFAAKEALMKAIGKGIRQEVWFSQIEVLNRESGAPYLNLSGKAEQALESLGGAQVHISLAHSAGLAVAVVILEQDREAD
jgi:holo-[acyl-carrier protein] synthase